MKAKRWVITMLTAATILRARCGGDREPDRQIDVDAVNALVPAELRSELVFKKGELVGDGLRSGKIRYTLATPVDWQPGYDGYAMLVHPDHDRFKFTHLVVGHNCDGFCQPKDWNAVIDEVYAYYLRGHVMRDVRGATSRKLIAQEPSGRATIVLDAHWKSGDDHYDSCDATLEYELQPAAEAFAKACEVVHRR